ncbi:MAG: hypothetical protein HC828_01510 [Blastochloris sp.]|nr:hypothetical protein [Blastochloris sp.]
MSRLIITACTATKRPDAGDMPAIDRYDGPSFRLIRKALRELPVNDRPDLLIISAEYGLLLPNSPIANYNRWMTPERAKELREQVLMLLGGYLDDERRYMNQQPSVTLINLGAAYLPALPLNAELRQRLGAITYTSGGIGDRLGQMKRWLYQSEVQHG